MKKDSKQRLFEVMGRLDSTFKPKLNEDYVDNMSSDEFSVEIKKIKENMINNKTYFVNEIGNRGYGWDLFDTHIDGFINHLYNADEKVNEIIHSNLDFNILLDYFIEYVNNEAGSATEKDLNI